MKKHIGTKVYPMLAFILIVVVAYGTLTNLGLADAKHSMQEIADTYMQMQVENEKVTRNIGEIRTYGNIIVLSPDTNTATTTAKKVSSTIKDMDTAIKQMEALTRKIKDEELSAELEAYKVILSSLEQNITSVASQFLGGHKAGAELTNSQMPSIVVKVQTQQTVFNDMLAVKAGALVAESVKAADFIQTLSVACGMVMVLVVVGVIVIISRSVVGPARKSSKQLNTIITDIVNNEGDLTKRLDVKTKDEVGQLVTGINGFINQLQVIMKKLQTGTDGLNEQVGNINVSIQKSESGADDVSAMMQEMSASMEEISATVEQIDKSSQDMLDYAQGMNQMAEDGNGLVSEIKDKAEHLKEDAIASKNSTVQMLDNNKRQLSAAIENSRSVSRINELTGEILSISSQTNLLALNASIEAARAGDAGRGFAVVAEEIRVLADNSRETANNIQNISGLVTQAVAQLAENANEMLEFIDTSVLADYDKLVNVSNQYHNDADSINDMLVNFREKSEHLKETLEEMASGVKGINAAVEDSAHGITAAADSTTQLVEMLGDIRNEAENNRRISEDLQSEVQRFKNI